MNFRLWALSSWIQVRIHLEFRFNCSGRRSKNNTSASSLLQVRPSSLKFPYLVLTFHFSLQEQFISGPPWCRFNVPRTAFSLFLFSNSVTFSFWEYFFIPTNSQQTSVSSPQTKHLFFHSSKLDHHPQNNKLLPIPTYPTIFKPRSPPKTF